MDWIITTPKAAALVLLSAVCVYVSLVIFTRLAGLRSFSKMSGFDFAITVAIGSTVASIIMAPEPPILLGIWTLGVLFALQIGFAALRRKFGWVESLAANKPRVIMIGREMQQDQMSKAKITESDLRAKLREANVVNYDQIKVVIAETTGDVSVIHTQGDEIYFDIDLIQGAVGADRVPQ